jgi:hypothetical protein
MIYRNALKGKPRSDEHRSGFVSFRAAKSFTRSAIACLPHRHSGQQMAF